jgi:hypothetical protein
LCLTSQSWGIEEADDNSNASREGEKNKTMETVYADGIAEIEEKEKQEISLLNECTTTPQKSNLSPSS